MYFIISSCVGAFLDRSPPLLSPPLPDSGTDSVDSRLNGSSPPTSGKRPYRENDEGNRSNTLCLYETFLPNLHIHRKKCLMAVEVL
jgi:hypothetical protein